MIWPWQTARMFSVLRPARSPSCFPRRLTEARRSGGRRRFGPVPLGGMTICRASGNRDPAPGVGDDACVGHIRLARLIIVRRVIGVTALAYAMAHIFIYFPAVLELCVHQKKNPRNGDAGFSLIRGGRLDHRPDRAGGDLVMLRSGGWSEGWQRLAQRGLRDHSPCDPHYLLSPVLFPDPVPG